MLELKLTLDISKSKLFGLPVRKHVTCPYGQSWYCKASLLTPSSAHLGQTCVLYVLQIHSRIFRLLVIKAHLVYLRYYLYSTKEFDNNQGGKLCKLL